MSARFQNFLERLGRMNPLLFAAHKIFAVVGIPGRELSLKLIEAEIFQHVQSKIEAGGDFTFDLFRHAEDVRVILGKAANAQQAVHHARALVAIHRAQFAEAHRQVAVRLQRIFVNQNVAGTVHGLQPILGVVELHGVEHILRVVAFVPRREKQLTPRHMRRVDQRVATLQVLRAHPLFHLFADDAALGMPENQPRPGQLLNGK